MTPTTQSKVERARRYIDVEGATIRAAADAVGLAESTLRYHLNGGSRKSGRGVEAPLVEGVNDELPDAPTTGIPVYDLDYTGFEHEALRVYPLGDVHLGSAEHEAAKWQSWLDYIKGQDDTAVILTGDIFNSAIVGSKSDVYRETMTVGDALKVAGAQLAPIADKIDLAIPGNHEERVYRAAGLEPVEVLADKLGVPYARKTAVLRYRFPGAEYLVYVIHGTGADGSSSIGGKANAMERRNKAVLADVYLSAHTHSQLLARDRIFDPSTGRWRRRLYASSGSFVGYESYAAERGWAAGDIGAARLRFDARRHDVRGSI